MSHNDFFQSNINPNGLQETASFDYLSEFLAADTRRGIRTRLDSVYRYASYAFGRFDCLLLYSSFLEEIWRIYLVVNRLGLEMINPRRLDGFVDQRSDPRKYLPAHKLLRRFYQPSVHTHVHATKATIAACRYASCQPSCPMLWSPGRVRRVGSYLETLAPRALYMDRKHLQKYRGRHSRTAIKPGTSNCELGNWETLMTLKRALMRTKLGVHADPLCSRQRLVLYKEGKNYAP